MSIGIKYLRIAEGRVAIKMYSKSLQQPVVCSHYDQQCLMHETPIQNMSRAFVLLNCDSGTENAIISAISGISGVSEAAGLSGVYDIIAKLSAESDNGISTIVTKIRSIPNIRSSLTMIVAEGRND